MKKCCKQKGLQIFDFTQSSYCFDVFLMRIFCLKWLFRVGWRRINHFRPKIMLFEILIFEKNAANRRGYKYLISLNLPIVLMFFLMRSFCLKWLFWVGWRRMKHNACIGIFKLPIYDLKWLIRCPWTWNSYFRRNGVVDGRFFMG